MQKAGQVESAEIRVQGVLVVLVMPHLPCSRMQCGAGRNICLTLGVFLVPSPAVSHGGSED